MAKKYEQAMSLPNRTAKNHLKKVAGLGLLRKVGATRVAHYQVVRS